MTAATPQTAGTQPQGKPLSLIDCDVHNAYHSPEDFKRYLPAFYRQGNISFPGGPGSGSPIGLARADAVADNGDKPGTCPDKMREQLLDAYGIDYAILTGGGILSIGTSSDKDMAAAVMRAYNEWACETWFDADPRFRGCVTVVPNHPQASAQEIRRIGGHPKIVQVMMTSATRDPLGDRQYWPIYEAACEMGLPVAVHPGAETNGISNPFSNGYPANYLEWHTNLSQNFMAQITSLICRGVFCEFPQLKLVAVEGGIGWAPHLMWRLDKNWKALRFTVPWLEKAPSEYLVEHVRFTTQPIEEPARGEHLLQMFDMVHAEQTVMFSSDYPHWDSDSPIHGLPRLPDELKARIFYKNAQALYNLPDHGPRVSGA